MNFKN